MNSSDRVSSALAEIATRAALLHKLGPDLLAIIDLDARNSSTRDGYPSGGTQDGPRGNSELTPTEASANARMGRRADDPVHRSVLGALDAMERAIRDLGTLTTLPDRIKAIQTLPDELAKGNDSWCWHAQSLGLPYDTAWDAHCRSNLKGLWPEQRPVCRWVRDYAADRGVLPSEADMRTYLERGVARVNVDPKKGRAA